MPSTYQPTLRDLIHLDIPSAVKISPDGRLLAVSVRTTNWKDDRYETRLLLVDCETGQQNWLTRTGNVRQVEWLDEHSLLLLKNEPGTDDKAQLWLYENLLGDPWQLTEHKTGVESFKPFAQGLLFLARHPDRQENKPRADRFGKFTHFEQEDSRAALYYLSLPALRTYQERLRLGTEDEAKKLTRPELELTRLFTHPAKVPSIQDVFPSPDGRTIYLSCRERDDLVYFRHTSAYAIQLDPQAALDEYLRRAQSKADATPAGDSPAVGQDQSEKEDLSYLGHLTQLAIPRAAWLSALSPVGDQLLLGYQARDDRMYTQADHWAIPVSAALAAPDSAAFLENMHCLSGALDQEIYDQHWVASGLYVEYPQSTTVRVARISPQGELTPLELDGFSPQLSFHASPQGRLALVAGSPTAFPEVYLFEHDPVGQPTLARRLTHFGEALANWDLGTVETIRWFSRDGVEIEGVLRKPTNFDPSRRYPLVFDVHGGPSWFSAAWQISGDEVTYYPVIQLLHKDVLVLKPNYRGSTGRGQAFLELNVNNLGVGDLWDLESAIDYLDQLGWVDPQRVGCMGWSQGGYISAFAGLHSERFKAVSVGAGISDWYTYHISNDIPAFTTDYLSTSPFRQREIYTLTAPISGLPGAKTPTLIQHGSEDRRVPLSNAHELYRGLQEMGVPVELFIYPGMAHPITRPRENHAVLHQNLAWFSHYLLGEDLSLE